MSRALQDIIGHQYGRLCVVQRNPYDKNIAVCECECGKVVNVRVGHILAGKTRSCGCLRKELSRSRCAENCKQLYDDVRAYKTNIKAITSTKRRKNNTSGKIGVTYNYRMNKWVSRIHVQGRDIYLGSYIDFGDAVKARRAIDALREAGLDITIEL